MKRKLIICLTTCSLLWGALLVNAQNRQTTKEKSSSKAWEIGVGGSLINLNRIAISEFESTPDNYLYSLKANHLMCGPNLYVARELNQWFYLDLQGTLGIDKKNRSFMIGPGLQVRPTKLFRSQYVEPYARIGMNYLNKNFRVGADGALDPTGEAHWESTDIWNPNGNSKDRNSLTPISLGAGVNTWLSNSIGLGVQGEYLIPLQKKGVRFLQVSARVVYRIGGRDKQPAPIIQYVEIEKPVDRIVERIVEVPVTVDTLINNLPENIHFEFGKDVEIAESEKTLNQLSEILKRYPNSRFVVTGYADAKGSDSYNMNLSKRRAQTVYEELIKRGVPPQMLKWRGVGKRTSLIPATTENEVRAGDRKVLLERVTNKDYWEAILMK